MVDIWLDISGKNSKMATDTKTPKVQQMNFMQYQAYFDTSNRDKRAKFTKG